MFYCLLCNCLYLIAHRQELGVVLFVQGVAIASVGLIAGISGIAFVINRKNIVAVMNVITEKNQKLLLDPRNKSKSDKILYGVMVIWLMGSACGWFSMIPFQIKFIVTGRVQFENYFYELEPYSFASLVHCILQNCPMPWVATLSSTFMVFAIEMYLRVSLFFQTMTFELSLLRSGKCVDEEEEARKLKVIDSDYTVLWW